MPDIPWCDVPSAPDSLLNFATWAEQAIRCMERMFAEYMEVTLRIGVPAWDICVEQNHLEAPDCLVPGSGIDQTQFVYAHSNDDLVPGNGLLPVPPGSTLIDYRCGATIISNDDGSGVVNLTPAMVGPYAVFVTLGNDVLATCSVAPSSRTPAQFTITLDEIAPFGGAWIYWLAMPIA